MFIYKYCSKCNKRNHKSNNHCVRCGDKLTTGGKFGKDVFAITLSIVILFFAVTAFAGNSYYVNYKANKAVQPTADTKKTEPTQTTLQAPEATTQPTTTPPATTTPTTTTKPVVTTPKTNTITTSPKPSEDMSKYISEVQGYISVCDEYIKRGNKGLADLSTQKELLTQEINSWYEENKTYNCCQSVYCACDNEQAYSRKVELQNNLDKQYKDSRASIKTDIYNNEDIKIKIESGLKLLQDKIIGSYTYLAPYISRQCKIYDWSSLYINW